MPHGLLAALVKVESGGAEYALNIAGKSLNTLSKLEALEQAQQAINAGQMVDLGCMQINHYWHGQQFTGLEAMLDPQTNIAYGAKFLRSLYVQHNSWYQAVKHYHSANLQHGQIYAAKITVAWLGR